ncbi:Transient receptor potential cation channel subfamily V member 5 [Portunus trituberculatus]|uniref:Transient receptor potential cation channel subfamily V member 5 n=1 Tax=Portunus trituberculatus TaxID=210409 RepID=A0A5B7IEW3_PORTR|nr:Transient receptor potential cation channel subfamily V member 5 [Portunus trituberculatus]
MLSLIYPFFSPFPLFVPLLLFHSFSTSYYLQFKFISFQPFPLPSFTLLTILHHTEFNTNSFYSFSTSYNLPITLNLSLFPSKSFSFPFFALLTIIHPPELNTTQHQPFHSFSTSYNLPIILNLSLFPCQSLPLPPFALLTILHHSTPHSSLSPIVLSLGSFFLPRDQQVTVPPGPDHTDYEGLAYLGEYPLAWSACLGNETVYNKLLDYDADSNAQDSFGNMILHMVVVCNQLVSVLGCFVGKREREKSTVTPFNFFQCSGVFFVGVFCV